jgi:hypothetical protein
MLYRLFLDPVGKPDAIELQERQVARSLFTQSKLPVVLPETNALIKKLTYDRETGEAHLVVISPLISYLRKVDTYAGYPAKIKQVGDKEYLFVKIPVEIWQYEKLYSEEQKGSMFISGCAMLYSPTTKDSINSCDVVDEAYPFVARQDRLHLVVYQHKSGKGYTLLVPFSHPFRYEAETGRLLAVLPYGRLYQIFLPEKGKTLEDIYTLQQIHIYGENIYTITNVVSYVSKSVWLSPSVLGFSVRYEEGLMEDKEEYLFEEFPYTLPFLVGAMKRSVRGGIVKNEEQQHTEEEDREDTPKGKPKLF